MTLNSTTANSPMATALYPCNRGMSGVPGGLHHFQAAPHGPVVCIYCGKRAPFDPITVTYGTSA